MHIHRTEGPGDILVFLTGQQEIEYACKTLSELDRQLYYRDDVSHHQEVKGMVIFPIYASLETFEQRAVFRPPPAAHRKVCSK